MLQKIRERFTGWIAITILAVIGASFVFVGLNYSFIGQSFAAKVDGEDIGLGQFEAAYRDQLQANPQLAQLPEQFRLQVRRNILEQLIQQRVIDNYLADAGYQVSDQQVTKMIQAAPDFQVNGRFDLETYRTLLAQAGREPAEFERSQRQNLRRNQLQRAIRGSALVTPADFRRFLNLAGEQRVVWLATIDPATVIDEIEVTEEDIQAWYDNNPTLYQLPESVDVEFVEVRRSDVAASVAVTEEELREYYDFNKDRYLQDEQRQARHILVAFGDDEDAAEAEAEALLARINAGESFAELAAEYSDDGGTAAQGGDLGMLTRTQLPGELGSAIFSMEEGEVTGPVRTDFGYHVIRLDRIFERGPLPFDQVRGELTVELQQEQAESLYLDLERQLSDALFDATDIRELAAAVDGEVQAVAGYTRAGGEPFGDNPAVIDAIFDPTVLEGGQLSEIVEIDGDRAAVFAVIDHREAMRQPLDEVRDEVAAALSEQQAETLMAEKADEILAGVEMGMEFGAVAQAAGATVAGPLVLSRNAEDVDQSVAFAVFTALKPTADEPSTGRTRNDEDGYTVYSVDAVIPGRPEAIPVADRDAGKMQLANERGIAEFIAFIQALRADADVSINEDALAAQDLFQ